MKAGPVASPPDNMRRALIFQGSFICAAVAFGVVLRGEQKRRKQDEAQQKGNLEVRMAELGQGGVPQE
jgi:FLVCR family MFS transporter 7